MKFIKSSLLVAGGIAAVLGIQGAVHGVARATANAGAQQITSMPTPLPPNVIVTNEPTVNARQSGTWRVQLQAPEPIPVAPVHLAAPAFLHVGARYAFVWASDEKPDVETVVAVEPDGWLLVSGSAAEAGAVWINAARAIRIERVAQ
ncbi:MAG: hypothetical protein ACREFP_13405 [Acetobacteraceae bacterium]